MRMANAKEGWSSASLEFSLQAASVREEQAEA
jgi:hypothetical protein